MKKSGLLNSHSGGLPELDCHAHVSSEVNASQLSLLDGAIVFAMTRTLEESERVSQRHDPNILWGCGVHPGLRHGLLAFNRGRLDELLAKFLLVGEIGLDKRAGAVQVQERVFREVMSAVSQRDILCSVHCTGEEEKALSVIDEFRPRGCILHWFTAAHLAERAVQLGCWFSINIAMKDEAIFALPMDRILPETDYPATRRLGVRRPGDIAMLDERLATLWGMSPESIRIQWFKNLRALVLKAGVFDRIPDTLADCLIDV